MGEPNSIITPESPGTPISAPYIFVAPETRTLRWYPVLEEQLINLTSGGLWFQLNLALLGIAIGAFISLSVTLLTVQLGDKLNALFVALDVVAGVFLIFFASGTAINLRRIRAQIRDITQTRT